MNPRIIIAVIAVAILVSVGIFTGLIPLSLLGGDFHTGISPSDINYQKTEFYEKCWGVGGAWTGHGNIYHPELIADWSNSPIVTSYKDMPGVLSEKIVVEGWYDWTGGLGSIRTWRPINAWYRVRINEGAGWSDPIIDENGIDETIVSWDQGSGNVHKEATQYTGNKPGPWSRSSINFQIKGRHVGALKVEFRVEFNFLLGYETHTISTDYVYLVSGFGELALEGVQPTYEMGETVPIWVSCDYSGQGWGDNQHWTLMWSPLDEDSPVQGGIITTFDDWTREWYTGWSVPYGVWWCGISNPTIRIELWNSLFPLRYVWADTIDIKSLAPSIPTISASSDRIEVGDSVTISGSVESSEEIRNFAVWAYFSDKTSVRVFDDTWIDPTGGGDGTYSFIVTIPSSQITRTGTLMVAAKALDICGRPSLNPAVISISVGYPGEEPLSLEWLRIIVVAIILVIFGLIAAFAPMPYGIYGKIAIFAVGIVISALVYTYVDFIPLIDWYESIWWLP